MTDYRYVVEEFAGDSGFEDNRASGLATALAVDGETLEVTAGHGDRFADLGANERTVVTLGSIDSFEIVSCDSRDGDELHIVERGVGASFAQAWPADTPVYSGPPAVVFNNYAQRSANLSDLPDKPAARNNLGLGSAATQAASAFAAASHNHPVSEVTGLADALTGIATSLGAKLDDSQLDDDEQLTADDAELIASQRATKFYVDQLAATFDGNFGTLFDGTAALVVQSLTLSIPRMRALVGSNTATNDTFKDSGIEYDPPYATPEDPLTLIFGLINWSSTSTSNGLKVTFPDDGSSVGGYRGGAISSNGLTLKTHTITTASTVLTTDNINATVTPGWLLYFIVADFSNVEFGVDKWRLRFARSSPTTGNTTLLFGTFAMRFSQNG